MAELDGKRIVWASRGKLFAAQANAGGLADERQVVDLNQMIFERIVAPY
jgi:hypothetical protein